MQPPKFTLNDLTYSEGPAIFKRALDLFERGKVGPITEVMRGYAATVQGTQPYSVSISGKRIDDGSCTCYMGQHDKVCKHMFALALAVLHACGKMVGPEGGQTRADLAEVKPLVTEAMKKLRPYRGPSSIWFSYQRALSTGAGMIADAIAGLPASRENARYLWNLVVRIDKKLANGVDDSDGTVGECISRIIEQLANYAGITRELESNIRQFCDRKTNFGFEEALRSRLSAGS